MIAQHLYQRRKVAAWHTLWELGQARAALRRMGETLPEPPARSREAFADAIYALTDDTSVQHGEVGAGAACVADNAGKGYPAPAPKLSVLPGGAEAPLDEGVAAGLRGSGQVPRHGESASPDSLRRESGELPPNFETEEEQ